MSQAIRSVPAFAARPTARDWSRHAALFLLTALTAAWAHMVLTATDIPEPALAEPSVGLDYLLYVPRYFAACLLSIAVYAAINPSLIADGAKVVAT